MGKFYIFILFIVILFVVVLISSLLKYYKRCPNGHIMVIFNNKPDSFGNTIKFIKNGGTLIWPIFSSYQLLSLAPINVDIDLQDLQNKQGIKTGIHCKFIVGITSNEIILEHAIPRISGLSEKKIQELAFNIISSQLRLVIAGLNSEEINQSKEFLNSVSKSVEGEITEIGLNLINTDIIKIEIVSNNIYN